MVEFTTAVIFFVILFAAPIQFYLSPKSSSDAKFYLIRFVDDVRGYFRKIFPVEPPSEKNANEDVVGETESVTDLDSLTIDELFGGGKTDPADKKEEAKDLFGGDFELDLIHSLIKLIFKKAKAPEWWLKKVHKDHKHMADQPNYTILIDTRDRLIPQIGYVAEENVIVSSGPVIHPLLKHYFEHFDGTCYKSRPWHKNVYPND